MLVRQAEQYHIFVIDETGVKPYAKFSGEQESIFLKYEAENDQIYLLEHGGDNKKIMSVNISNVGH